MWVILIVAQAMVLPAIIGFYFESQYWIDMQRLQKETRE